MKRDDGAGRRSRRSVLSAFAGTGVAAVLPSVAATGATPGASNATAADGETAGSTDSISLGTFESDLDGWLADGAVALSRVGRNDRPVAVTEGEYALEASAVGDPSPAITLPVAGVDLRSHPYLVADVAPGRVDGTDAPIVFRFRLYRRPGLPGYPGAPDPVAESDPVTIRQATPGRIYWDASDVTVGLLDPVSVLEIGWHPAGHDPDSPGGGFAAHGRVAFDDIRASASVDPVGTARLAATMRDLQFEHGVYERTVVTREFGPVEEGAFVFVDGAAEPYRFETLADERFRLAVAGTAMRFGVGWSR